MRPERNSSTVTIDLDDNGKIAAGDLVLVNYTASLEDGTLLGTTLEKTANDPGAEESRMVQDARAFSPGRADRRQGGAVSRTGRGVAGNGGGGEEASRHPSRKGIRPL